MKCLPMGSVTCERVESRERAAGLYLRMKRERLTWAYLPDGSGLEAWVAASFLPGHRLYVAKVGGRDAGILEAHPPVIGSFVYEAGTLAFREFFALAIPLAFAGFGRLLRDNPDCSGLTGRIPSTNRHALRLFGRLGFRELCRVPRYFRILERGGRSADLVFVYADRESLGEAERAETGSGAGETART